MKKVLLYIVFLVLPLITYGDFKTGLYMGVGAGGTKLRASQVTDLLYNGAVVDDDVLQGQKFKKNSFSPNIFLGYRYRKPNQPWTISLETSFLFKKTKTEIRKTLPAQNFTANLDRNFGGTLQLKPGYIFGEKYMLFGIFGVCFDRYKWDCLQQSLAGSYRYNNKKTIPGLVFGAGVERAIKNVHVGIQTSCACYKRKVFESALGNDSMQMSMKPKVFQASLYLSYAF